MYFVLNTQGHWINMAQVVRIEVIDETHRRFYCYAVGNVPCGAIDEETLNEVLTRQMLDEVKG